VPRLLHKSSTIRSELKERFTIGISEKGKKFLTLFFELYNSFWNKKLASVFNLRSGETMKQVSYRIALLATLFKNRFSGFLTLLPSFSLKSIGYAIGYGI
jgi:hypothetical protein